jgi:hypothetical protein
MHGLPRRCDDGDPVPLRAAPGHPDGCSTIVTSQLPLARWHEALGDPTLADAILDRLLHDAHRIELSG